MYITSEKTLIFRISNIFDLGSAGHKCFEDYADPNLWQLKVKRVELEEKEYLEMSLSSKNINTNNQWICRTDQKIKISSKKNNLILENTKDVYLVEWEKLIDPNNEYITDSNLITVESTVEESIGFRWKFRNASKLNNTYTSSDEFYIANIPWKLLVRTEKSDRTANEKCLGVYSYCRKDRNNSSWTVRASFQLCLLSQKRGIEDKRIENEKALLTAAKNLWGTSKLIKWNDLIDPEKGYILNDTIEIKVLFTKATISDYTSHDNTDEQLKKLLSEYVERNLENSREQIFNKIEEEEKHTSSHEKGKIYKTSCGICMEKFSDKIESKRIPRILSGCETKHTICESCAKNLMDTCDVECPFDNYVTEIPNGLLLCETQQEHGYIRCPFDGSITEVPNGKVGKLSENGYLLRLLAEETSRMSEHDVVFCDDDRSHIATKYCLECQANYCSSCLHASHSRPSLSKHTIVPINEKTQNIRCPEHINNIVELYCIEEGCKGQRIMCPSCYLYGTHKGHKHEEFKKKLKCVQEDWQTNMDFVETAMKIIEKEKRVIERFHGMLQENGDIVHENTILILDELINKIIQESNDLHCQKTEYIQKRSEENKYLHRKIELFDMKIKYMKKELLTQKKSDISTFFEFSLTNQVNSYMRELEDIISSFSPTTILPFCPDNILKIANDFGVFTRIVIFSLFQQNSEPARKMIGDVFRKNTQTISKFKNLRKYGRKIVELNSNFYGLGKNQYDSVIILVSRAEFEKHRKLIHAFTKTLSNYIVAIERTGTSGKIDFGIMKGVLFDFTENDTWSIIRKLLS